jgi:hypothetical protein
MSFISSNIETMNANVVTYKDYNYKLKDIPKEFQLIFDVIDEEAESYLMSLMDVETDKSREKLKQIMKDIAMSEELKKYYPILKYKINTRYSDKIKKGDGMMFHIEDKKFYNPQVAVISFGSDIQIALQDIKTNTNVYIPIPRRSMFIIRDPQFKYKRGIAKREVDRYGSMEVKRGDRYSIVLLSKIE